MRDASCSLDAVNSHVEPSPSHSCARRRPCTRQRAEQGRSQRHPEDETRERRQYRCTPGGKPARSPSRRTIGCCTTCRRLVEATVQVCPDVPAGEQQHALIAHQRAATLADSAALRLWLAIVRRAVAIRKRDHGCTGCGTWGRPLWHSPELALVVVCRPRRAVGRGPVEIYRRLGSRPSTGRSRTPWRGLLTCGTGPSPR